MNSIRKIVSYVLIALVLFFTVIGLLGIWGVIDLDQVGPKIIYSLMVIFGASAVILFIFTVMIKDNEPPKNV